MQCFSMMFIKMNGIQFNAMIYDDDDILGYNDDGTCHGMKQSFLKNLMSCADVDNMAMTMSTYSWFIHM